MSGCFCSRESFFAGVDNFAKTIDVHHGSTIGLRINTTYGYLKNDFGSLSYGRGDDVCLIRTDANGDSLWVKKYHLAYDLNGTFNYCPFTAWLADSSRTDSPTRIIEVGTDIFITGFTIDYHRI